MGHEISYCPDCGAKQPRPDARFCLKCGAALAAHGCPGSTRRRFPLWLIPALLLVGALVALLAWSPMRNQLLALLPGKGTAALAPTPESQPTPLPRHAPSGNAKFGADLKRHATVSLGAVPCSYRFSDFK